MNFQKAREAVLENILAARSALEIERVHLLECLGRVLATPVFADRDIPPFPRSTRDGYAIRRVDVANPPSELRKVGTVRAGESYAGKVGPSECVEIMTGAPLPEGADAVIMVEYTSESNGSVHAQRAVAAGENVVLQRSEAKQGSCLLEAGRRIGYPEVAMMASVGNTEVAVRRRPRVAIIPTGDEIVEVDAKTGPFQIRNSNGYSLHAQVSLSNCVPVMIGIAPDEEVRLKEMIRDGLGYDLLLLSGGVSMGKYDLVEKVLAELDAKFYFDGVLIQPGKPLVFGRANDTFFFGLPGNPLSTMVTFELFVRPALALLSGEPDAPLQFLQAKLACDFRRKPGLTSFLPATLEGRYDDLTVSPVDWKGSGDIASITRANCYLVINEPVSELRAGDWVPVLLRH